MPKIVSILLLLILSSACLAIPYKICFTPGGQCTDLIVNIINTAQKTILVQAYSFTSAPIAKALANAQKRGVDVKIILDKSQRKAHYSSTDYFLHQSIPVWIDYKPAIAHNKVMIIDDHVVITGSFNFTKAAQEKNAENVIVLDDKEIAEAYRDNWYRRFKVSERG